MPFILLYPKKWGAIEKENETPEEHFDTAVTKKPERRRPLGLSKR
jgi:hypothetical protein